MKTFIHFDTDTEGDTDTETETDTETDTGTDTHTHTPFHPRYASIRITVPDANFCLFPD